ncbi:MAG: amino acid adenylation domain-containing protein [Sphingomonas bacterium]
MSSIDSRRPMLLHDFLRASVAHHGQRTALEIPPGRNRADRQSLSYAALDAASDRLALHLAPLVAGEEAIVAVHLPRTLSALYVAQLGALKAGAAFTCLDLSFPEERMREIVEDADARIVLTDRAGIARLGPVCGDRVRLLDVEALLAETPAGSALPQEIAPDRLAYVIYTSGTTGKPKGVMIEHRNIANLVAGDLAEFPLGEGDRVVQGSSCAYDSSIEEIWLAFASGATLVVMDDDAARLGPDIVRWLRDERATVFCPPPTLLRSSGCADPAAALPDLKLLYVGGEALPRDIADLWSVGRRLVNGYGPTECAVTCLRGDIVAGGAITIGRPVPGMSAYVLDDDLAPLADGQQGELCIGGAGVARGYRNRPELTAEKFVDHPALGRLYRTGDLVHRDEEGDFFYHGRIDAQVKIRGYRVELGEIEMRLASLPGVRAAGCRLQDQDLVAFVVAEDPAGPPDADALRAELARTLPRYMVPGRIGLIDALPVSVGGKLNRAALPVLELAVVAVDRHNVPPETEMERLLAAGYADILKRPGGVSVEDDFFEDLGGDSLSAALLVTLLREDRCTDWITVSDIYDARTVRALALLANRAAPEDATAETAADIAAAREGRVRPVLANIVQTGWLGGELLVGSWVSWIAAFRLLPPVFGRMGFASFVLLSPLLAFAAIAIYVPVSIAFAVAVKWVVIGRYRPIRAPVWSGYYLRHWIVFQAARLVPWPLLQGTVFQQMALRALGARIGRGVHIHRGVDLRRGGWDLLEIGDYAALGQDARIGLVELDRGDLVIAPIVLEAGATMRVRSGVEGHCRMGEGSVLTALSVLNAGHAIPAGEMWDGVPAASAGPAPAAPERPARQLSPLLHSIALLLAEGGIAFLAALPAELLMLGTCLAAGVGFEEVWRWIYHPSLNARVAAVALGLTVASVPLTLVWTALLSRMIGRVRPGTIGCRSLAYVRVWVKTGLLLSAGEWLSGTLFWSKWLRLAGMRVGAKCEISTILDVVPELVEIGAETFFADGIYLGGGEARNGTVTLAPIRLGRNTFLGNHAVIPAGEHLPDDILIGIATVADAREIVTGQSRFGHPSFDLPRREVIEVDRSLTHDPSAIRYANRMFWEVLRFALPIVPLLLTAAWFAMLTDMRALVASPAAYALLVIPAATLLPLVGLCATVLALKWLLIGRVKPGQHALWSCWCSRWDFVYVAWAKFANLILQGLEGTFILPVYLRMMGLTIGRRAVLGPQFAQVVDPDMIHIGDGATVTAMFQAHTFEDRVLKTDKVFICAGATVSAGTVPLYGAMIGERAHVGPHSVIMKQEHLLPGLRYQGVPTRVFGREDAVGARAENDAADAGAISIAAA